MPCDGAVTKYRAIASAVVVMALISAGCNSRLLRPPVTIFADGGGRQISATIRDRDHRFNSVLLSFFPSRVPLHPGDAVNFEVRDSGEPHTVALGKLVERAITALGTLGLTEGIKTIESLPQMRKLPSVFPNTIEETPRVNASAADRCFLDRGAPAVSTTGGAQACAQGQQPAFDGTQEFYSSGFLEEGEPFRVKLSSDIRPGTYSFMCLVHRSSMIGSIEVRPTEVERPPVANIRQLARDEENEVAGTLEQPARRAAARNDDGVLAGTGPVGRSRGLLSSFIPEQAKVSTGEPLTWELYGMHSISFDPSRDAQEGVLIEDGEGVRINPDGWDPVESSPPPAAALSFPPTMPSVEIDGGSYPGEGAFSSGILRATAPAVVKYTLRFEGAGTYRYRCLVHPRMRGRVVVE